MTFSEDDTKPLAAWRLELKKFGKRHWLRFYQELMGQAVSNIPRFYKALKLYGDPIMFDAIVTASMNDLTGDPFFYVVKVASNKWKDEQEALENDESYEAKIKRAIEESQKHNDELAKKLGRV